MIPSIIHFCWFGGETKPTYVKKCIKSWRRNFPDFELMEWNESNTDLNHPFLERALKDKKWAFLSDFVRIQKLYEYGGLYLDTDLLMLKGIPEDLFKTNLLLGFENSNMVNGAFLGCCSQNPFIYQILEYYKNLENEKYENILIPKILTNFLQKLNGSNLKPGVYTWGTLLKREIIYPLPYKLKEFHWKKFIKEDTVAVHLWAGSWVNQSSNTFLEKFSKMLKYQFSRFYVPRSFLEYADSL